MAVLGPTGNANPKQLGTSEATKWAETDFFDEDTHFVGFLV